MSISATTIIATNLGIAAAGIIVACVATLIVMAMAAWRKRP